MKLWSVLSTESDVRSGERGRYRLGVGVPGVNFLAEPGQKVPQCAIGAIRFGRSDSGDQSILAFPSWSMFSGSLSGRVPFLIAELRP